MTRAVMLITQLGERLTADSGEVYRPLGKTVSSRVAYPMPGMLQSLRLCTSPSELPVDMISSLVRRISHGMIRPPDSARALRGVYREMRLRYIFRNRSKSPQLNFWRHHPANPSPDPAVHTQESGNPFHPPPFRLILGKSGPNVKTHPKSQNNLFWEARVPKTMTCPGRLPTTSPRDMHI